jgi:NAD(P)-dependent dehydrogenase (short-subunit alcohol dehydrogenase family)
MSLYRAKKEDGAVWVTGASTGIGRELVLALAREGWTVAATARSADKLAELEQLSATLPGRIHSFPADVTDKAAMADAVSALTGKLGPVVLAIFNAGNYWPASGDRLDIKKFSDTYAINVMGQVNGLVPIVDQMKAKGRGQIMIVASVSGYSGLPMASAYGASKAALINMAESLKFDFDRMNIRIQIVNPGFIETPLTDKNQFKMPALMPVDKAVRRMIDGIATGGFELTFPRRFTWLVKFFRLLPYPVYFWLMKRATGTNK